MNFLKTLLPLHIPLNISNQGDLAILRERIFQSIMVVGALLAILFGIFYLPDFYQVQDWINFNLFLVLILGVIGVVFLRRLPFLLRSIPVLITLYGVSIWLLINSGLEGHGKFLLLAFCVLSAIFAGLWGGVGAFILSIFTLLAISLLMIFGRIPIPLQTSIPSSMSSLDWGVFGMYFLVTGSMVTGAIGILIYNIQGMLQKQANLTNELKQERDSLENRIQQRTQDLQRRLSQIHTSSEISRTISSVLDPQEILHQVVSLIQDRFDLYYAGVFLLDEQGEYAILRAGTGEAGQKMIAQGHRLLIGGTSMIGWCISNRKARIALQAAEDVVRFSNPYLPLTRSELALPIFTYNRAMGAISIQSVQMNAFDEDDILILQGIADSLAIALENATLFQQTQATLEEIRTLNRTYLQQAWDEMAVTAGPLNSNYENPQSQTRSGTVNIIHLPITLRDQVLGQLVLETEHSSLSPQEMAFVEAITTQTALALENARLLQETQRRAMQEEKLNQLSAEFSRAASIEEILKVAVQQLSQLPSVSEVIVHLIPPPVSTQAAPSHDNGDRKGNIQ